MQNINIKILQRFVVKYIGDTEYFKFWKQYLTLYSLNFLCWKNYFYWMVSKNVIVFTFISQYDNLVIAQTKYHHRILS
jgi:hypothetical protein